MVNSSTRVGEERLYKPSWINRYNKWVEQQPLRNWIFYALIGFVLVGVQLLILWLESGLLDAQILPVVLFNGLFTPFLLALIHLLDNLAVTILKTIRRVLNTSESKFEQYKFMLGNMPSRPPLVAGLTVLVLVILMERLWIIPVRYAVLEQMPVFAVVFQLVDKSSAFLFGVFIYHTFRQLRLVNEINSNHIRINLYNLAPSRAFSKLTATTSVGLLVGVYGWMLINPDLFTDPVIFGIAAIITILAVTVFVWPLYGVHKRIEFKKDQVLHEIDLRFETIFAKFNQRLQEDDFAAIDHLNGTISSLEIQHRRIKTIPTWPWIPETAQIVLSAIVGPLILATIRFFIERVLG